ncbi:hypothetical protein INR49_028242 [Caranx melampygus]|nr:hypothetical protein INR49_028242 [Caranx melampygus]
MTSGGPELKTATQQMTKGYQKKVTMGSGLFRDPEVLKESSYLNNGQKSGLEDPDQRTLITSVLWAEGAVVGAVAALLAEVDVGSDAALQERLGGRVLSLMLMKILKSLSIEEVL